MENTTNEKVIITCGNSFHNTQEEMEVKVFGSYMRLGGHQKVLQIVFPDSNTFCTAEDCICGRDYIITDNHPDIVLDFIEAPTNQETK